jgi:NADPH2:quinone reductase
MGKPEPALPFYSMMVKNIHLLWVFVYGMAPEAIAQAARDVNAWLAGGRALLPPFSKFSLKQLADAHVAVEKGAVGKVLVEVQSGD